jgi:DNA-binding MarR family transcriptional regulator
MPRRAESDQDSQCSATATRQATRRMTQLYDDALAPAGLRSTQYAIVDELHRKADAPPTMGELAETLVPDRSALGHNLRRLERDGLIALVAGDADRRLRRVVLTTKGVAKLREARRG